MNIRHFNLRGCVRPFSLLSSSGKLVMGSICYFTFKSFSSQIDVTSPKAESFCLVCTIWKVIYFLKFSPDFVAVL